MVLGMDRLYCIASDFVLTVTLAETFLLVFVQRGG